jgi:hydroxymethylpyrimidine/phosphomethylpyrimidine kinase
VRKTSNPSRPLRCALTVAGSDSGGGAGVQADLRMFWRAGVHGTCVLTAVTAQNPRAVRGVLPLSKRWVRAQLDAVWEELRPNAIKTGMLGRPGAVEALADFLDEIGRTAPPLVVDPVMIATSGARLLSPAALRVVVNRLLPRAALITPNLAEAAALLARPVPSGLDEMSEAASELHARLGVPILLKGGHLDGRADSVDILRTATRERRFTARRVLGVKTHGTGCALSAAITAALALGMPLENAVAFGKRQVTRAIAASGTLGNHSVLG